MVALRSELLRNLNPKVAAKRRTGTGIQPGMDLRPERHNLREWETQAD